MHTLLIVRPDFRSAAKYIDLIQASDPGVTCWLDGEYTVCVQWKLG